MTDSEAQLGLDSSASSSASSSLAEDALPARTPSPPPLPVAPAPAPAFNPFAAPFPQLPAMSLLSPSYSAPAASQGLQAPESQALQQLEQHLNAELAALSFQQPLLDSLLLHQHQQQHYHLLSLLYQQQQQSDAALYQHQLSSHWSGPAGFTALPYYTQPFPFPQPTAMSAHYSPPAYSLSPPPSSPVPNSTSPLSASPSSPLPPSSSAASVAAPVQPVGNSKLIVRYLPPSMSATGFHHLFSTLGPRLVSSNLILHRQTHQSLCYGFLSYDSEEAARTVRRLMNSKRLDGRVIEVEECRSVKEGRNGEKRVVRIEGWAGVRDEDEARTRCSQYGEIEQLQLEAAGTVVVHFVSSSSAHRCIEDLHVVVPDSSAAQAAGQASRRAAGGAAAPVSVSAKFVDSTRRGGSRRRGPIAPAAAGGGWAAAGFAAAGRGGRGRLVSVNSAFAGLTGTRQPAEGTSERQEGLASINTELQQQQQRDNQTSPPPL